MSEPKRYAVVGTGARAGMYLHAAAMRYPEHACLVGLCDPSRVRLEFWTKMLERLGAPPAPAFGIEEFDAMLARQRVETLIVTSVDATHDEYIVRALEAGCDVVTEKPMTTDADKARRILDATKRTGRSVRVTFNYRWNPGSTLLRQLILEGRVGQPLLVDFMWTLDTSHGADYFRRWHREKRHSGGLLVHKASHHFDLVNFWIDSIPAEVVAMGGLRFYGREAAAARGEERAYDRYTDVAEAAGDPFALSLRGNDGLEGLYLAAERETGYLRDRNVFGDEIDIEDTVGVLARYENGVQLNYSLVAYSPWEGLRVCITGTKGRIELFDTHGSHIIKGQSEQELAREQRAGPSALPTQATFVHVFPMFGEPHAVPVPKLEGSHGGADRLLLDQIFDPGAPVDPFGRSATERDGAAAALLGFAANRSLATGAPVRTRDLLEIPPR
jgi:predicted dehydrogenase